MNASTTGTEGGRGRVTLLVALLGAGVLAAMIGAYLDWRMWPVYSGLMITIAAGAILLAGALVALVGRGIWRRIGLVVLAVGIGLVAGQNLGPSREPLIQTSGGTITLRLESPVVASATSRADCSNVASQTEFQVTGDPNMRLDTPVRPFVMVYINAGDRWAAIEDAPRKDGVRLEITSDDPIVPADGKSDTVGMHATASSTLDATFSNEGGSIIFSGLEAQTGPDYSGDPVDFAGTIEWTCGEAIPDGEAIPE